VSNSIRNRLLFLSTAGSVLAIAVAATAFFIVGGLHSDAERAETNVRAVRDLMQGDMCHDALRGDVFGALLAAEGRCTTREQSAADIAAHAAGFRKVIDDLKQLELDADAGAALARVEPDVAAYVASAEHALGEAFGTPERAEKAAAEVDAAFKRLESSLEALGDLLEQRAVEDQRASGERFATASTLLGILLGAGSALAVALALFGHWMSRGITNPITGAIALLRRVAERDFTPRMQTSGDRQLAEMANSLNQALDSVQGALEEVRSEAVELASVATSISAASTQLSSGSQEQASALEETAASLEEITGTVKQNADSAKQAAQLANSSRATAQRGGEVVGEAVASIREISSSSKRIAAITGTIDEIAFQTNLLALNAAVEAARAGEQGRGFAVVATEVRNLAQRSAQAAKEIKALIEESVAKIDHGTELVDRSGRSLEEIVASVERVDHIIAEIAAASQEQSIGVEQVNRAVTQMDQTVQANAAQTNALAGNASTLAGQAQRLQTLVQRFRLGETSAPPLRTHHHEAAALPRRAPAPSTARRAIAPKHDSPAAVVSAANDSDHGFIEM
jgi:methyl-accepting chemotaxis protein